MSFPGGKSKTFHQIINLIPPHDVYIEPFLGLGSVLRAKRPSKRDIGIEIDSAIYMSVPNQEPSVELYLGDGISFLESFPFGGREVVYCDPPYLAETRRRPRVYKHDFTEVDHRRLLAVIVGLNARVLISGYENDLYNGALSSWRKHLYRSKTHVDVRQEVVWFNYEPPSKLHDYRYLGADFRQRQNIQRRIKRLKRRLCEITPQERALLANWLLDGQRNAN